MSEQSNKLLEQRLNYLEDVNRYTVDVLEQALTLFDYNLRDQIKQDQYDKIKLLKDTEDRVRKILPLIKEWRQEK